MFHDIYIKIAESMVCFVDLTPEMGYQLNELGQVSELPSLPMSFSSLGWLSASANRS